MKMAQMHDNNNEAHTVLYQFQIILDVSNFLYVYNRKHPFVHAHYYLSIDSKCAALIDLAFISTGLTVHMELIM